MDRHKHSSVARQWIRRPLLLLGLTVVVVSLSTTLLWLSDFPNPGSSSGADRDQRSSRDNSPASIQFLSPVTVGLPVKGHPKIGSISVTDLDRDGLMDILVCDMDANRIGWVRQSKDGSFAERSVGPEIRAPARVQAFDMDRDGDLDMLVASMGKLLPTNDKVGSVLILENRGQESFTLHVIATGIARVTDVRGGDLNRDGLMDLVVGQFGYFEGETRWMENLGHWKFKSHILQKLSGPIHTIPADMEGDGDLDIVSIVSQEWEEIYLFENDGRGHFRYRIIFGSTNDDYGSSGMRLVDLDRDGDLDVLFTNGDAFDSLPPRPKPWHAVQWLENQGKLQFAYHRIGYFHGASAACAGDVDHDGDLDVIAVSAWNHWEDPESPSLVWFENDGRMGFTQRGVINSPTHLICLEAEDVNRDGWVDFVSGGMNVYPPYARQSRVSLWLNRWERMKDPIPRRGTIQQPRASPGIALGRGSEQLVEPCQGSANSSTMFPHPGCLPWAFELFPFGELRVKGRIWDRLILVLRFSPR